MSKDPDEFEFPGKGHQAEPDPDSAEARAKKYAHNQQGLRDWAIDTVQSYADVIRLALSDPLPVDDSLRKELEEAGKRFNLSRWQVWKVLQKHYRESDAHIHALAEEFVTKWEDELREANDRERLGEIDDEEDIDDRAGGAAPESVRIRAKTKEFIEVIHEKTDRDERDIKEQLRSVMRDHKSIGEISADPPGAHVWMRAKGRFRVTPRGVFAPLVAGLFDWERICKTPIEPLAHSSMHLTDREPRVHLNVLTSEGKVQREIEISREKISVKSVSAAITELTRSNVYVVRNDVARSEIIEFLNFKPKGRRIVRTKSTGWLKLDGEYCFILPLVPPDLVPFMRKRKDVLVKKGSIAKEQPETIIRLDRPIGGANRTYGFGVSGTVEEWRNKIAKPLEGCSNIALAIGVSFAGPVLLFAHEQTGGFNIYGPSTIGKSAADAVGESVYGIPSTSTAISGDVERFGARWATACDVGIVALAQKRTDTALFLDELGSAKSIRDKVVDLIYILTGGTPKLRADSQGNLREQQGFRNLMFSTGEIPLRTLLEKLDDTEGRKKRLIDVPALVGEKTALETIAHEKLGEICSSIYANTACLHGTVGQAWLRYLVDLGEVGIRAKLDQYRETWLGLPEIVKLIHSDPKDDSVIRRFALLAAALRMSIDAGLWPWSVESSDRAIAACCLRWAADKDSSITTLEERAAEQKLREAILTEREANRLIELKLQPGGRGGPTFKPNSECAVVYNDLVAARKAGLVGGFIKNDGHKARILLYPEAFRRCSAGCGLPHDALVEYLKRAGFLEIKNEKVKGETEQYYVLTEAFLRSETTAVNA